MPPSRFVSMERVALKDTLSWREDHDDDRCLWSTTHRVASMLGLVRETVLISINHSAGIELDLR